MESDPRHPDPSNSGSSPYMPRPEELPPVTPPSAGYIIQLFLIPALIVAAVVAVWALFGKLADSETDWKQMVAELGSSNEHRRWRSALGLAQLLRNDELAPEAGQIPLAEQPIVVDGLLGLLKTSLDSKSVNAEDITHQEFLVRTLGSLRADDKVLPVLATAMTAEQDSEVRKSALMSVAAIAGRHFERMTGYQSETDAQLDNSESTSVELPLTEPTIRDPDVWKQLRLAAQDADPVVRHLSAFAVASVSGPEAMELLRVMLLDGDANTRANAAIGLARNGSIDGLGTLSELLQLSGQPADPPTNPNVSPDEVRSAQARHEVEQSIIARNCLRAIESLWPRISEDDHRDLRKIIEQTAEQHFAADVRAQARALLKVLSSN